MGFVLLYLQHFLWVMCFVFLSIDLRNGIHWNRCSVVYCKKIKRITFPYKQPHDRCLSCKNCLGIAPRFALRLRDMPSTSSQRKDVGGLWQWEHLPHSTREVQRLCAIRGTASPPLPYKYTVQRRLRWFGHATRRQDGELKNHLLLSPFCCAFIAIAFKTDIQGSLTVLRNWTR